jgi:hypothetical protein
LSLEGRRIRHPKYGEGKVVSKIGGAFLLLVKFDNGITFYVRRDECRFLEPKPRVETPPTIATESLKISLSGSPNISAASFLETLRLGIVPNNVGEFTFGRESELDRVESWTRQDDSPPLLIVGDYGSGKSHLLECVEDRYLKRGWVISSFQLDPNECPLHRPKRVYSKIIRTMKILKDGEELGFRDLMKGYADLKSDAIGHDYLDLVLGMCRHRYTSTDYVWDWIEGTGPISCYAGLPLYDDAPSANIYCSILSGIATLARKSGFQGFLIMLDEAEQISGSWYAEYQFLKGLDFFAGLAITSSASDLLIEEPQINDDPPPTLIGPKSRLPYSARKPIHYCRSGSSPFKVIFAFSDIQFLQGLVYQRLGNPLVVHLRPLGDKAKKEILKSLYETYTHAYPNFNYDCIDELVVDIMSLRKYMENVRMLIKAFIEALDIVRYYSMKSHRSFLF